MEKFMKFYFILYIMNYLIIHVEYLILDGEKK